MKGIDLNQFKNQNNEKRFIINQMVSQEFYFIMGNGDCFIDQVIYMKGIDLKLKL